VELDPAADEEVNGFGARQNRPAGVARRDDSAFDQGGEKPRRRAGKQVALPSAPPVLAAPADVPAGEPPSKNEAAFKPSSSVSMKGKLGVHEGDGSFGGAGRDLDVERSKEVVAEAQGRGLKDALDNFHHAKSGGPAEIVESEAAVDLDLDDVEVAFATKTKRG